MLEKDKERRSPEFFLAVFKEDDKLVVQLTAKNEVSPEEVVEMLQVVVEDIKNNNTTREPDA